MTRRTAYPHSTDTHHEPFTAALGELRLHTFNEKGKIVIEITDSWIGLQASNLPVIFDAFTQANVSIMRKFGGMSLGLAITNAIVAAHDGRICARSDGKDKRATFTVSLPLHAKEPPDENR